MCNKPHPFSSIKKHLTTVHNMNPAQQQAALDRLESCEQDSEKEFSPHIPCDQGEIQPAR